jgi:hypothetical protein
LKSDRVQLQRLHHVGHEALRVQVDDARIGLVRLQCIAHGMHQVRLAETHTAVQKQRVVGVTGVFGHLVGCGQGQLVGFALDEGAEGVARDQVVLVLQRLVHLGLAGLAIMQRRVDQRWPAHC